METIDVKVLQSLEERFDYALYSKELGKENLLSDLVCAMCQSDKRFLKAFFEFCYYVITDDADIVLYDVCREVNHEENGRSDFNIYTSMGTYVVESKIWNTITNVQKYLPIVDGDSTRITYIVPEKWSGNVLELENYNIKVVRWEDFIEKIKNDYNEELTFFTRKAELILDMQEKYMPSIDSVKEEVDIIEDFKNQFFSEDEFIKKNCNWIDNNNPYFGYDCWGAVWFGISYNPLKGVFFCFTIGKNQQRRPVDINDLGPFQKSISLGKFKDESYYFEVAVDDIKNMNTDTLDEAFREFAKDIKVITNENDEVALLSLIKYKRKSKQVCKLPLSI